MRLDLRAEDHGITVDSLANVRVLVQFDRIQVLQDRYQCLLRSNVWNEPIHFWNRGHQLGLSVALAEAVESHAGLFRCRKQWWPKLLDTKRSCSFVFAKDVGHLWMNFIPGFFLNCISCSSQGAVAFLKNDWLEIGGLSCNSSFQLLKVHEENWNRALFQTSTFVLLDSRLIHSVTMQQSLRHLFGVGRCTYP